MRWQAKGLVKGFRTVFPAILLAVLSSLTPARWHLEAQAGMHPVVLTDPSAWQPASDRSDWIGETGTLSSPKGLDRSQEALLFLPNAQVADGVLRVKFRMTSWPHYIQAKLIFRSLDSHRFYMVSAFSMATDMGFSQGEGLMGLALWRGNASGYRELLSYVPYLPWKPGRWYEMRVDLAGPLITASLYSDLEKRDKPLIRVQDTHYLRGSLGVAANGPAEFKDLSIAPAVLSDATTTGWKRIEEKPYWPAWPKDRAERGAQPRMIRTPSGSLLLAASEMYFRPGPTSQVFLFGSSDEGRTWKPVSSVPVGYTGQLFAASDDTIWLLDSYVPGDEPGKFRRWTQEDVHSGKMAPFVPHIRKSRNDGKSWTEAEPLKILDFPKLSFNRGGLSMYVPPRKLQDGSLLLPVMMAAQKPDPLVIQPLLLRSSDQGKTWHAGLIDPNHADASETDLIELTPHRLLALMRTNFFTGFNGEARSRDGGKSWTPIKLGGLPGSSSGPRLLMTKSGALLCLHRFLGTMFSLSRDEGQAWRTFQVDTPIEVMGDLLELPGGRVLVVYSAGGWAGIPRLQSLRATPHGIEPAR